MDVHIDTNEIADGVDCISVIIERISSIIDFMKVKLNLAGNEFETINFERALLNVNMATNSLTVMNSKLAVTQTYLNNLIDHIEQYNKLKF